MRFDNNSLSHFLPSLRNTFTSWWRVTAMRASSVQMLTRTYCWQRRRYLLERTCLHLLAPLDSRMLLAASVKMKYYFLFFPLRKEWALLFSALGRQGMASICTASTRVLGKTWWPKVKIIWKSVLHSCVPDTVQAIKIALPHDNAEPISLFITDANFTHSDVHLPSLTMWSSLWMPYL